MTVKLHGPGVHSHNFLNLGASLPTESRHGDGARILQIPDDSLPQYSPHAHCMVRHRVYVSALRLRQVVLP